MEQKESPIVSNNIGKIMLLQNYATRTENCGTDWSNLCVKINSRNDILVGSERGCVLLSLDGAILSSFATEETTLGLGQVTSAVFDAANNDTAVIASDNAILYYDIRESTKPIFRLQENSDEINQLSIRGQHLAACDDSGEIKLYDLSTRKSFRTLRNKHKNICSTVCFRENAQKELFSGSLDCQLILWDYSKIKVLDTSNTQEIFSAMNGENSAYMFNPPMVNAIDCSKDGGILACGTGNGSIIMYSITKGRKLRPCDILCNHSSLGVSCVNIFEYKNQKYLLSGGNDCKLNSKEVHVNASNEVESHHSFESSIFLTSKLNNLTSFSKDEKLFYLVCDQSSHLKLFEHLVD